MVKQFLLAVLMALLVAVPAFAGKLNGVVPIPSLAGSGYVKDFTSADVAGVYEIGPVLTTSITSFTLGSGFSGVLYVCDYGDADADGNGSVDTAANCDTVANLTAEVNEQYKMASKRSFVVDINTAESAGYTSRLTIRGSNTLGGVGVSTGSYSVSLYSAGSSTGGIVEALAACEAAGGGVVILPPGNTAIDATSITSPVINMPTSTSTNQALCDLIGFGDSLPASGATTMQTGSSITISNSSGKTGIRVNSSGQRLADFTLQMLNTNASTIGIEVSSKIYAAGCDGTCEKGELGIDNWSLENVNISGPASLGPGIGLDITFALKGEIYGGEIQRWDSAINFSDPADVTGSVGHSNANVLTGISLRESDIGINAVNAHGPDLITLVGTTIEGNTIGAYFTGPSGVTIRKLVDHSSHWENNSENLRLSTDGGSTAEPVWFEGFGSYFTGATIDITRDYYAAGWDPDKCTGCFFSKGITYTNFARLKSISSNWYAQTTSGAQTNATGTFTVVPSFDTCTSFYGVSTTDAQVAGDVCYDAASNQSWICEPGADGVCNSAAEWFLIGGAPSITTADTGTGTAPLMAGEFNIADRPTATGDIKYTLPSAVAGMRGCFYDDGQGDGGVIVDANTGDEISLDGTRIGVADRIDSPGVAGAGANGDMICVLAIDATTWITYMRSGTWVDGGAS